MQSAPEDSQKKTNSISRIKTVSLQQKQTSRTNICPRKEVPVLSLGPGFIRKHVRQKMMENIHPAILILPSLATNRLLILAHPELHRLKSDVGLKFLELTDSRHRDCSDVLTSSHTRTDGTSAVRALPQHRLALLPRKAFPIHFSKH